MHNFEVLNSVLVCEWYQRWNKLSFHCLELQLVEEALTNKILLKSATKPGIENGPHLISIAWQNLQTNMGVVCDKCPNIGEAFRISESIQLRSLWNDYHFTKVNRYFVPFLVPFANLYQNQIQRPMLVLSAELHAVMST